MENISAPKSSNYRRLSNEERKLIFETLLKQSDNGRLKHGSIQSTAKMFCISEKTVSRIWQQWKASFEAGTSANTDSKAIGSVGHKKVLIESKDIASIPLRLRTNIRSMDVVLKKPKSTVFLRIKEGLARRHSNAIKPTLIDENKKVRLLFCLSMIDHSTVDDNPTFFGMFNQIHIDEKWFFMTKISETYYLLPEESNPYRTCKSKRFITKVMFMAAVARPRFDEQTKEMFSGKIGIFPFVHKEPAKRKSKNHVAGTIETKPITSITKEVARKCLIEKVLPAIRERWPHSSSKTIYIQQDNAKPHIDGNDPAFLEASKKDGFDFHLMCQPVNSPDLNVLDLGFFRAIQSLQHREAPKTVDELVTTVEKSFDQLTPTCLDHVFLTLQLCMVEIMKKFGGNQYKIPHASKDKLERIGQLPTCISFEANIFRNAESHLNDNGS